MGSRSACQVTRETSPIYLGKRSQNVTPSRDCHQYRAPSLHTSANHNSMADLKRMTGEMCKHRVINSGLVLFEGGSYLDIAFDFNGRKQQVRQFRLIFCSPSLDPVAAETMHNSWGVIFILSLCGSSVFMTVCRKTRTLMTFSKGLKARHPCP